MNNSHQLHKAAISFFIFPLYIFYCVITPWSIYDSTKDFLECVNTKCHYNCCGCSCTGISWLMMQFLWKNKSNKSSLWIVEFFNHISVRSVGNNGHEMLIICFIPQISLCCVISKFFVVLYMKNIEIFLRMI